MPTIECRNELKQRQDALLSMNLNWIAQGLELLAAIDDANYTRVVLGIHKVGSHLRHVIEFYECFLEGVAGGHVDYDARRREDVLSTSRFAAAARLRQLAERLANTPDLRGDSVLFVKAEDADALGLADPYTVSSVGRELISLSSHTIHHFALIALALRAQGKELDRSFGVAPSTLRFEKQRAEAA